MSNPAMQGVVFLGLILHSHQAIGLEYLQIGVDILGEGAIVVRGEFVKPTPTVGLLCFRCRLVTRAFVAGNAGDR
jgi:hypothetical protein